jgi:hypothetical protein
MTTAMNVTDNPPAAQWFRKVPRYRAVQVKAGHDG